MTEMRDLTLLILPFQHVLEYLTLRTQFLSVLMSLFLMDSKIIIIYTYIHAYIHIYMYIHTCIHTYIHAYIVHTYYTYINRPTDTIPMMYMQLQPCFNN